MKLKKRLLAMLLSLMMVASVAIQPISMVSATTGGETPIETDGTGGEAPPATMVITSASLSQGEELQVITQSSTTSVNLPKMNVTYDDSSVGTIDVTWTPDKAFDVNVAGTYTYTATVNTAIYSLAQGVTLPNFTVKVEALQEEQKTIKTITAVEVVNTQNFTAGSGEVLTLPQLNVTYDDNTTESIAVVWTADTVVFDVNAEGTYVYTASIDTNLYALAEGVTLPNFTAVVSGTQEPKPETKVEKVIKAIEPVEAKSFTVGDEVTALTFPQLTVTFEDDTQDSIDVTWTATENEFVDTTAEGVFTYTATIGEGYKLLNDTVILPEFMVVVTAKTQEEPETRVLPDVTVLFDINGNYELDEDIGEVEIQVMENATIALSDLTGLAAGFEVATWKYYSYESGGSIKVEFSGQEGVTPTPVTSEMKDSDYHKVILTPYWTVWFDADEDNEYNAAVDLKIEVINTGSVHTTIRNRSPLDEMNPQASGWKICGTEDKFVFDESEIRAIGESEFTKVTSNLKLCPVFEVPVYFVESDGAINFEGDANSVLAIGRVELGSTIGSDTPGKYGGTIGEIMNAEFLKSSHGYINFEGWYTSPNGGEKWIFRPDASPTMALESHVTKDFITGSEDAVDAIILYIKADALYKVEFLDEDYDTLNSTYVEEGGTVNNDATGSSQTPTIETLIKGANFTLETGEVFREWRVYTDSAYKTWEFGTSGTKVDSSYVGGEEPRVIYLYPIIQEKDKYTIDFDLDGDGFISYDGYPSEEDRQIPDIDLDATVDVSDAPEGYQDVVWKDQDGNIFEFNEEGVTGTPVTENKVLTPHYKVQFKDDEGSGATIGTMNEDQLVKFNGNVTEPANNPQPSKGSPNFWYIDENNNGQADTGEKWWNFDNDIVTDNIVLTPSWDFAVSFDEDGDGVVDTYTDPSTEDELEMTVYVEKDGTVDKSVLETFGIEVEYDKWFDEQSKEFILDDGTGNGTKVNKNYIVHPQQGILILLDDMEYSSLQDLLPLPIGKKLCQDIIADIEGGIIDGSETSFKNSDFDSEPETIVPIGTGLLYNGTGLEGFDPETQMLKGWYTGKDGTGTKFEFGENGTVLSTELATYVFYMDKYILLLHPHVVTIHTVGFDLDGDGNADTGEDTTVEDGKPIDKTQVPDTTTPPKYWVDEDGNEFEIGKTPVTEDEVLTPVYEVKFEDGKGNVDGANGKNPPKDVVSGTTLPTPQNPQTDGTLEFWYVDKNDNGVPDAGETVWNFNTDKVTENMTLTPHYKYNVSVNETYNTNNNGSGSYAPGTTVNINTGERPNYTFTGWTVTTPSGVTVTLNDASSMNTSFTMPNGSVTITANWVENTVPQTVRFTLTVVDGSGDGTYTQGTRVSVSHTDSATPEGQEFVGWDTNGDGVVDVAIEDFTYTMPGRNVVIRPVYQDLVDEFELTVNGGDGDGTYEEGEEVDITLGEVPEGEEFVGWDTDGDGDVDVTDEDFTFTMPDENTTITAVFEDVVDEFELTVNGGDGDGTYEEGEEVDITLGEVPEGQEFVGWDTDGDGVVDVTDEDFTFVMPDENTTITAIYEDIADDGTTGGTGDDTGGGTGGTITPPVDESEITKVTVGGNDLSEDDYYFDENGDLVISPDFIATLPDGRHVVRITTVDGENFEAVIIVEDGVPTSMSPFEPAYGWSLFDMIMTVVAVVIALIYLIVRPRKNDSEHYEAESEQKHKNRIITSIVLFVFALFSIILLIVTQDFTQPMMIFDLWSIVFAIVALVQMVIIFFVRKKNDDGENSNQVMTF